LLLNQHAELEDYYILGLVHRNNNPYSHVCSYLILIILL